MSEELDPEIARLLEGMLGDSEPSGMFPKTGDQSRPGYSSQGQHAKESHEPPKPGIDLARKAFTPVRKFEADKPAQWFSDPNFYKTILEGGGDEAKRIHELLSKYLKAADSKDRLLIRQQLITAWWYLASKIMLQVLPTKGPTPKRLALRFALALPNLLTAPQLECLHRIIFEKATDEPIFYIDEWMNEIAAGTATPSATDEVKAGPKSSAAEAAKANAALQKVQGKLEASAGMIKLKNQERFEAEETARNSLGEVCSHQDSNIDDLPETYSDHQKKLISEMYEVLRRMLAADKELAHAVGEYSKAREELRETSDRVEDNHDVIKADSQSLVQEFETVRQMAKICIGRQGNHFPILSREYFHGNIKDVATRENVLNTMAWIESIDSEVYCRMYKSTLNRIVPIIIIVPSYGDSGMCWEPFDRFNRATSRGRIAVPMYPKNLLGAVLTGVADFRWQVAKEKAAYYWMEEGLTGHYYQWFTIQKLKGDVKEFFIQDYLLWITKESEGVMKLDKEVRGIFWRFMPFTQEIKDKLKSRSYIYQELYQKELNRSVSDGY